MNAAQAERSVTTSAAVVAGVYAYRRLFEGQSGQAAQHVGQPAAAKQLAGLGGAPPLSHFIVGFGFAYLAIAVLAQADPALGGGLAVLVATTTLLTNGVQIFSNVERQLGLQTTPAPAQPSTPSAKV